MGYVTMAGESENSSSATLPALRTAVDTITFVRDIPAAVLAPTADETRHRAS